MPLNATNCTLKDHTYKITCFDEDMATHRMVTKGTYGPNLHLTRQERLTNAKFSSLSTIHVLFIAHGTTVNELN